VRDTIDHHIRSIDPEDSAVVALPYTEPSAWLSLQRCDTRVLRGRFSGDRI
jgi:hypothetical protein